MKENDQDDYITLKEAASRLGISENAMRIRRSRNRLPVRVHTRGGRLYVCPKEIEVFHCSGGWESFNG